MSANTGPYSLTAGQTTDMTPPQGFGVVVAALVLNFSPYLVGVTGGPQEQWVLPGGSALVQGSPQVRGSPQTAAFSSLQVLPESITGQAAAPAAGPAACFVTWFGPADPLPTGASGGGLPTSSVNNSFAVLATGLFTLPDAVLLLTNTPQQLIAPGLYTDRFGVAVTALQTNSGTGANTLRVGDSNVGASRGQQLVPGQPIVVPLVDGSALWGYGVAGDGVCFLFV